MRVRYICDSCRSTIAEFDHASLTAERLGLLELSADEWPEFVQQAADALVLISLCDECASVLETSELPTLPVLPRLLH